jgi:hypothetical protein
LLSRIKKSKKKKRSARCKKMESPELSGLLYKRRGGFGKIMPNAWQYRFFTISKDGILQYFDTEIPDTDSLDSRARGRLDLRAVNYEVSVESIEGAPTQYPIAIVIPNEETWKLCCYGKDDHQRWVKALEKFQHSKSSSNLSNMVGGAAPNYTSDDENADRTRKNSNPPTNLAGSNAVVRNSVFVTDTSSHVLKPTEILESHKITTILPDSGAARHPPAQVGGNFDANKARQSQLTRTSPSASGSGGGVHRRVSLKKRLKLAGNKGFIDQETGEAVLVLFIINICFIFVMRTSFIIWKLVYILIGNFVIAHTLQLRSARTKKFEDKVKNQTIITEPEIKESINAVVETMVQEDIVVNSVIETVDSNNEIPMKLEGKDHKPFPGLCLLPVVITSLNHYFLFLRANLYQSGRRSTSSSPSYLVCCRPSTV